MRDCCRKCGGGRMNGPHYEKSLFGEESLRYVCGTCGYEEQRPTADAKPLGAQSLHELERTIKQARA